MKYHIALLSLLFLFSGCVGQKTDLLQSISSGAYIESSFDDIPSWKEEDFGKMQDVFLKTCEKVQYQPLFYNVCKKANKKVDAQHFFEQNFTPFIADSSSSLATGYYEPILLGAKQQNTTYPYPLYGVPRDLLRIQLQEPYRDILRKPLRGRFYKDKVIPYFSRQEIEEGVAMDAEPLCYVKDKVDLFILQVQGSGRVLFDDNTSINVGFADHNGHPYTSIGKEMLLKGYLSEDNVSLESIYTYLQTHQNQIDEILNSNARYVFFKKREQGVTGALGMELISERSVAVDKSKVPLGMPLFISTEVPLDDKKYERMAFAHDTGSAIEGEARIDIFFGSGDKAKEKAGKMKADVMLWMLVPNDYLFQSNLKVQ